jgi:hypothetical protein
MTKYLIGLGAVLFPALLLYPNGEGFARDWPNHVWMVGYFGEYIRDHGAPPVVVNTREVGGITFPIFYGYLFYPLLGLFSTHLHPEIAVRGAALLMLAAQYVAVRKTMRRLKASEGLASGGACLTIWSVYGLTNLYNRSALTEFFAVGMLTCAVCSWFDLLRATSARAAWRRGLLFGLQLTLAIGFHPITGLFSLPLLAVLVFALPERCVSLARLVPVCGAAAVLSVLVLAPWVYAVRKFDKELAVAAHTGGVADLSQHIDHWRTRLHPLPYDSRCAEHLPADVSTPYLDGQIHYPLLILALALAVRHPDGGSRLRSAVWAAVPLLYAVAMLYLSVDMKAFDRLPPVFIKIQFLYRLVSYVNLGFLLIPLFVLLRAARYQSAGAAPVTVSPVLLCFVLTYSGFCVLLKLQHAEAARIPAAPVVKEWTDLGREYHHHPNHRRWVKNAADRNAVLSVPMPSYGHTAYSTPRAVPPLSPQEQAALPFYPSGVQESGPQFGKPPRLVVTMPQPGYVGTQMLVFPWTRFEVDGQLVPPDQLRSWSDARIYPDPFKQPWTAVPVPAGTHTVHARFEPNRTWRWLYRLSWAVLVPWIGIVGGWSAVRVVRFRRAPEAPGPAPIIVPIPLADPPAQRAA